MSNREQLSVRWAAGDEHCNVAAQNVQKYVMLYFFYLCPSQWSMAVVSSVCVKIWSSWRFSDFMQYLLEVKSNCFR